jgi:hypothetical protein
MQNEEFRNRALFLILNSAFCILHSCLSDVQSGDHVPLDVGGIENDETVRKGVSRQEHGAKCGSFFKDRDYGV